MLSRLVLLVDGRISTLIGLCAGTPGDPGGEVAIAATNALRVYVVVLGINLGSSPSDRVVRSTA
jgi:hypothetical protein